MATALEACFTAFLKTLTQPLLSALRSFLMGLMLPIGAAITFLETQLLELNILEGLLRAALSPFETSVNSIRNIFEIMPTENFNDCPQVTNFIQGTIHILDTTMKDYNKLIYKLTQVQVVKDLYQKEKAALEETKDFYQSIIDAIDAM